MMVVMVSTTASPVAAGPADLTTLESAVRSAVLDAARAGARPGQLATATGMTRTQFTAEYPQAAPLVPKTVPDPRVRDDALGYVTRAVAVARIAAANQDHGQAKLDLDAAVVDARRYTTVRRIAETLGRWPVKVSQEYSGRFADVGRVQNPDATQVSQALQTIVDAQAWVVDTEKTFYDTVRAAHREAGVTWIAIGAVLGLGVADRGNLATRIQRGPVVGKPKMSAPEQAALLKGQLAKHRKLMSSEVVEAARLRIKHPDLSQPKLAALSGIPMTTLQHRLERALAAGAEE